MAVLGSLRRNSFVLIAVIGMALFAFVIAGVFDGNSFQSQEPIGEVNGETLSLNDFRTQVDVFQKQYNFRKFKKKFICFNSRDRYGFICICNCRCF